MVQMLIDLPHVPFFNVVIVFIIDREELWVGGEGCQAVLEVEGGHVEDKAPCTMRTSSKKSRRRPSWRWYGSLVIDGRRTTTTTTIIGFVDSPDQRARTRCSVVLFTL